MRKRKTAGAQDTQGGSVEHGLGSGGSPELRGLRNVEFCAGKNFRFWSGTLRQPDFPSASDSKVPIPGSGKFLKNIFIPT